MGLWADGRRWQRCSSSKRRCALGSEQAAHGWICLFAQMCGTGSPSGRLAAMPPCSADFVMDMLVELDPLMDEAKEKLPAAMQTPLQKKMTNGKVQCPVWSDGAGLHE